MSILYNKSIKVSKIGRKEMRMTIKRARYGLYRKYIKELAKYDHELRYITPTEVNDWAKEYIEDKKYTTWIDLYHENKIIGFIIITHNGEDCHPDCDHFISQTYVLPEHRRNGYVTKTIIEYMKKYPGIYGYDVIIGNNKAKEFWTKLFDNIKANPVQLKRYRDEDIETKLDLFGYQVC